jgi:hypothetical protein
MKFQLVIQFFGFSLDDYDALIAIEDELTEQLGESADVDGHDFGMNQMNIFIFTNHPHEAFEKVKQVLGRLGFLENVKAAFRGIEEENFTFLWPKDMNVFKVS